MSFTPVSFALKVQASTLSIELFWRHCSYPYDWHATNGDFVRDVTPESMEQSVCG